MKYIWIIMLIILEIIWFICSLKDFIYTAKHYKPSYIWDWLEDYTAFFIISHLLFLFGYSLALFIKGIE